jgi:2-methylisocitrate lyase-like PEP mutase family enzyme
MVQKVRAATDARTDPELVILARTDAIAAAGFEAALDRAAAYIEAGADMTFVEAPRTPDELRQIPARLGAPQLVNIVSGGVTPMVPLGELRAMRFAVVLYSNAALQAAIEGMQAVLRHLREHGSLAGIEHRVAGFGERQRLVAKPLYDALERKYASREE